MKRGEQKLNDRQWKFVEAYDGNATAAARLAGYSAHSAEVTGAKLLRNPKVAAAIRERQGRESQERIASRQQRQVFWTEVMTNAKGDMKDRLKASELLGKSEGDFLDKVHHTGALETVIVIKEDVTDG